MRYSEYFFQMLPFRVAELIVALGIVLFVAVRSSVFERLCVVFIRLRSHADPDEVLN